MANISGFKIEYVEELDKLYVLIKGLIYIIDYINNQVIKAINTIYNYFINKNHYLFLIFRFQKKLYYSREVR